MTRTIAIIACITIIDCLTGAFGWLNEWLPAPPEGGITMGWKIIIATVAVGVLLYQAARFAMWLASLALTRTGWLGREFGRSVIRGMTEAKGRSVARDLMVAWIWERVGDRRLSSTRGIAKAVRGETNKARPAYDGPRVVVSDGVRRVA